MMIMIKYDFVIIPQRFRYQIMINHDHHDNLRSIFFKAPVGGLFFSPFVLLQPFDIRF
jgi:hypothetical protein